MAAWFLVHVAAKLAVPQALDIDAAEQAYFAQALRMGYGVRQPPLYTWAVWLLSHTGLPLPVLLEALRYTVLAAWFGGVWAVLRQLGWSPARQALAWLAHLGLAVVMWTAHDSLTHTALAAVLTVWAAALLLRLWQQPSVLRAAAVGVLAALAVLAKFNAGLWLASAFAATLLVPPARQRMRLAHWAAGALAAAAVLLPYAVWWLSQPVDAAQLARQITVAAQPQEPGGAAGRHVAGVLADLLQGALFNVLLAGLLVGALAGRAAWARTLADWRWRWLALQVAIALAVTGGLLMLSDAAVFKGRWLWPVMPLAALVLLWPLSQVRSTGRAGGRAGESLLGDALLAGGGPAEGAAGDAARDATGGAADAAAGGSPGPLPRRLCWAVGLAVALSFIAAAARFIEPRVHAPRCNQCWTERDTDAMARVLRERWGDGRLIVTAEHHLAGGLAAARPPLRSFMAGGPPGLLPPPPLRHGRYDGCAAAWVGEAVPPALAPLLDARDRPQSWSWPMPHAPQRRIRLSTQAITPQACAAWASP